MPPLIETVGLGKTYHLAGQSLQALADVNLRIERGEFVAVMGRSGSGKSTLMNQLGCLDTPTSGTYRLDGTDVSGLSADRLARLRNDRIGFCFQSFNLLQRATAIANVELPLLYAGLPPGDRHERAREAIFAVGLADRLHHLPSQLSGGQQQRVSIARAIVNRPLLILADEPTGTLDERTGLEIMTLFQTLNRSGMTLIVVTHDPEIARFANRVISLRDGHVVEVRTEARPLDAARLLADHAGAANP